MPTRSVLPGVVIDQRAWPASGGGFADVFKVIYKGRNVAVKRLRFFAYPPSKEAELDGALCKEAIIWKHLEHPFVLPFMGVCILDPETGFKSTVSPWCDLGNLGRHLAGNKPLDVGKTLLQIAMGIEYLHSQNVVHGDISGNNVLLTDNLDVQICDFGLGKWQETSIVTGGSRATPGTVRYTAPELHRGERPTYASDVYAFACLALEICTRKVPFSGTETMGVASRVCRGDRPPCPEEILDQRLWDLIEECWSHQPDERPSTARVVATIQGWGVYLPECGSVSQE
ncbi:kinase-like domain-containing protein [Mycena belliarum]|uniref:Kinase-like domain-containing protein n=1 Tax=Mycena belliarum TaxID=1033014 RepID=A0AAD6U8I8_9AGAR|nr:kinase-like domain-containing protein [Mycena belliae]